MQATKTTVTAENAVPSAVFWLLLSLLWQFFRNCRITSCFDRSRSFVCGKQCKNNNISFGETAKKYFIASDDTLSITINNSLRAVRACACLNMLSCIFKAYLGQRLPLNKAVNS